MLIALHSFTPVFKGVARAWHAGVLYNRDPRFAHRLFALLNAEKGLIVGDNEPYTVSDATDYTIPVHAERRGLHHVLIEIRQDLIADEAGSERGLRSSRDYCRRHIRTWRQPKRLDLPNVQGSRPELLDNPSLALEASGPIGRRRVSLKGASTDTPRCARHVCFTPISNIG